MSDSELSPFSEPGGSIAPRSATVVPLHKPKENHTTDLVEANRLFWQRQEKYRGKELCLGFPRIDRQWELKPNDFAVLAGRPGSMKTTLALQWAVNLCLKGKSVLWLNVDMPESEMSLWVQSRLTGIPYLLLRRLTDSAPEHLLTSRENALDLMARMNFALWQKETLQLDEAIDYIGRAPYDAVFIDYVQQIRTGNERIDSDEYRRVSQVSSALKAAAKRLPTCFVVLAQMNRGIERSDRPRFPVMSDLKGSGQLEQDATHLAFMHRPDMDDPNRVQFRIEKNRNGAPQHVVELRGRPEIKFVEEEVLEPVQVGTTVPLGDNP